MGGFTINAGAAGGARSAAPRPDALAAGRDAGPSGRVVVPACAVADLPEEHASRKERFAEIDDLQPGWRVELREKPGSDLVDAVFYSPDGTFFKSYAAARRAALDWSKGRG